VGFDKSLTEEDIAFVKENVKKMNDKDIVWSVPEGLSLLVLALPVTVINA
jgi:hypothetical protein